MKERTIVLKPRKPRKAFASALSRTALHASFTEVHGDHGRLWSEFVADLKTGIERGALDETIEHWKECFKAYPHMDSALRVKRALYEITKHPEVRGDSAMVDLCFYLAEGLFFAAITRDDPLEAFVALFSGAERRISNPLRAIKAHASKNAERSQAWDAYKSGGFSSYAEGARVLEVHFRKPGDTLSEEAVKKRRRQLRDYFAKQGAAEGLVSKPGARPKTKRRKKAGVVIAA